jgi:DNA-binding FadR family transcriptional regulator
MENMPNRMIQPIHRRQVSQALIDRLLWMISEGYWAPGDKLPPQRELAQALEVGMSTLREALQSLQTMGVLKLRHGDGTYLAEAPAREMYSQMVNVSLAMGKADLEMLFDARGVIETGFAFLAAEHATDEQVAELFRILEEERKALLEGKT